MYNVKTSNDYLKYYYTSNQVLRILTITRGNYTCYTLLTYLQNNFYNMTVIYNSITNKYTFSSTYIFCFELSKLHI